MSKKDVAVIGMGKFGLSLALCLSDNGYDVIVIDKDADKIAEVAELFTFAAAAQVEDEEALREAGVANVDVAVICIGTIEDSVLATVGCKELGVPQIIAKATNDTHAKILQKVGADMTLIPEAEMGVRLAKNIMAGMFLDFFEISDNFSMAELRVPEGWIGHKVSELNIRAKYHINIVAIKKNETVISGIGPDTVFTDGDILIIAGENKDLSKLNEKNGK